MPSMRVTFLKLLILCALANSVCCVTLPVTIMPKTFETTTDPPAGIHMDDFDRSAKYLIVRGEGPTSPEREFHHVASLLMKRLKIEERDNSMSTQTLMECSDPANNIVFSGYDYTVLLAMLGISLGIGVFYGFFQSSGSSSSDFLLGSGMSLFPVTLSLTTSFITAIELLGNPSEMYFQGTQFILIVIPMFLVIPVAVKVFYPIFFKMQLTSCYEYLGIRFGKELRLMGAILYVIQMCFYTSVAVLAPAIALSKVTGLNTTVAVILIYLVCVFYSSQGGMKAVVIADSFQAAVLGLSLVLVMILGFFYSGNPIEIFKTSSEHGRLEFFNFNFNPTTRHTVWSVVIGGFFYWTSLFCTNQASVQKCMSLKSLKLATVALGFAVIGLMGVFLINFYTGLMVFSHYATCDPLTAGRISAPDQLLPYYIINTYGGVHAMAGIYVAGIFAASLGTVAAALNSLSAVTCEDLLINGLNIKISPDKGAKYAQWMSLGYGILSFALVFVVEKLGGVLQATLTLNGLIGGVTLGLFMLGITFKRANTKGAFYGGLVALAIVIFIGVVSQLVSVDPISLPMSVSDCDCRISGNNTEHNAMPIIAQPAVVTGLSSWPIFHLSYMWYSMIGALLTIILGYMFSEIINAVQKRNVLKINSTKGAEAMESTVRGIWKPDLPPTFSEVTEKPATVITVATIKLGHDNYAMDMADEGFTHNVQTIGCK